MLFLVFGGFIAWGIIKWLYKSLESTFGPFGTITPQIQTEAEESSDEKEDEEAAKAELEFRQFVTALTTNHMSALVQNRSRLITIDEYGLA